MAVVYAESRSCRHS